MARKRAQALTSSFLKALQERRWEEASVAGEELIARMESLGETQLNVKVKIETARSFLNWNAGSVGDRVSRSKALLDEVLDADPQPIRAAEAHCLMAAAHGLTPGDRSANTEKALASLEEAEKKLTGLDGEEADHLRSQIRTNRSHATLTTDGGDADDKRDLALEEAKAGLEGQDPRRDSDGWAIAQINLGSAQENLMIRGDFQPQEVAETYELVRTNARKLDSPWYGAFAALGTTRVIHRAIAMGDPTEARALTLMWMEEVCLDALDIATEEHPEVRGRLLRRLGEILWDMGDLNRAKLRLAEALELLTLDWPDRRLHAAKCLAAVSEKDGDLEGAVEAYRIAIEASELSHDSRIQSLGRQAEANADGKLYRWASGAMLRFGLLEEAAITLEKGLAREFGTRARFSEAASIEMPGVPAELVSQMRIHARQLSAEGLSEGASGAAVGFYECREAIRAYPGYERFGLPVTSEDLAASVQPGWPVVYVNPVPSGLSIILIDEAGIRGSFSEKVDSEEIERFLLEGDVAHGTVSYVGNVLGVPGPGSVRSALELVLPWIGERVIRPLVAFLGEREQVGLSLIPCGWLPLVPLQAAHFEHDGQELSLLDLYPTRFSPSGKMLASSLERSESNSVMTNVVALGNPDGTLPVTEAECETASETLGAGETALGDEASMGFFRTQAPSADLLHIGCHAEASLLRFSETGIRLHDGVIFANEVVAMPLKARLAVASACQTAVPEKIRASDESFSFASCLMAAGARCVVASHWRVNDIAAGILMVRFYNDPDVLNEPAVALQRAHLWMRDLSDSQLEHFLDAHPTLHSKIKEALDRAAVKGHPFSVNAEWLSHPHKWAGFATFGS
ncbi:MAG: CHAT domain-containing protein [Solirubrobacterales bacterium]|nr:CHAT domain-containing protein [Solirubrobacterales bacterium]